jgi:alkylation response protein AidB-like acyl-CoA dehydrogenase
VRVTVAVTREQAALRRSIVSWAAADAGRAWTDAAALGLVAAAVPEKLGGASGSVADAAAALEAAADALVPGPVLPTVLGALLLCRHADPAAAEALVPSLADGTTTAAVALDPSLRAERQPDGGWRVTGVARAVPGAAGASVLVLGGTAPDGAEVWFSADAAALRLVPGTSLDLSRDVADVHCDAVAVTPGAVLTATAGDVRDLAATLAAAEAAGVAAWSLRTATEYGGVREQFGRPIGSFQAVKHLCAEMLCRREEAVAVAWDAARAQDESTAGTAERGLAAAVAAAVALDAAVENAKTCIQVLGGIGFTWEHDAHRYLRRALALRQWLGGGTPWRQRAAALTRTGSRRRLDLGAALAPAPGDDAVVEDVRALVAALPDDPAGRRVALAESGWLVPHWPPPHGRGASAREQLLAERELAAAGVERPDLVIGAWAVPTIVRHGTDEQRERFVMPTLRGEIAWCQLFSEPGAGSDLASLRTRAERVDGGWALTGQKVWTSLAHACDWAICLARTGPEGSRHRGITYFLVDMRSPGIDIRPLREITGEARFNEVFLDGVVVPDDCVVGPVDGGWRLARATLAEERVAIGGSSAIGANLERLLAGLADGAAVLDDDRLGGLVGRGTALSLVGLLATARRLEAEATGGGTAQAGDRPESAVTKLLGVRHRQDVAEAAYDALGPAALAVDDPAAAAASHELLLTRALSIAGGTTQVLLTLAAERILGLPREPA